MWFFFALGSGLAQVLRNVAMKHLGDRLDETINVWGRFTFLLPFCAAASLWQGIPPIDERLWITCLVFALVQAGATLSLSKALKLAEISLVTSLWKISLLFLIPWGFFWFDETPSLLGCIGVLVSLAGVYLLNADKRQISPWAPFLALWRERGQLFALISAFLYAPAVILMKQLVLYADPFFAAFMAYLFSAALLTPYAIYRSGRHFLAVRQHWRGFLALGFFAAVAAMLSNLGYRLTFSAYVEAVKQIEMPLALLVGYLVFGEKARVKAIWRGSLLMLIGIVLLKFAA